jgi:hypothetical protein
MPVQPVSFNDHHGQARASKPEPSRFDVLGTWQRHLIDLQSLKPTARMSLLRFGPGPAYVCSTPWKRGSII